MIPFVKSNFGTKKIGTDKIGDFGKMRTEGYDRMCQMLGATMREC